MKKTTLASFFFTSGFITVFAKCTEGEVTKCITDAGGLINSLNTSVVTALGTLFLAASVVGFLLGVVRFIWAQQQGDEKGVKSGKETLKWGIIALFCAFSIYGIIKFMQNTLLPSNDPSTIVVPTIKIEGGANNSQSPDGTVPVPPSGRVDGTVPVPPASLNKTLVNKVISDVSSQPNSSQVQNSGVTNTSSQTQAQQAYNTCMGNGNSASECQAAYAAYGGVGDGQQSQALQAYNECKNAGNSEDECQSVYAAYGGSVE